MRSSAPSPASVSLTIGNSTGRYTIGGSMGGRVAGLLALVLALACVAQIGCGWIGRRSSTIPARLSDDVFWALCQECVRNARHLRRIPTIWSRTRFCSRIDPPSCAPRDGVYIGVGPEQNFSYIARTPAGDGVHHRHPAERTGTFTCCTRRCSSCRPIASISCRGCSHASDRRRTSRRATVQELFEHFDRTTA